MTLRDSGVLPEDAAWTSSPEPKAVGTARLLTDTALMLEEDLLEAGRDESLVPESEFHQRVIRAFETPARSAAPGWEPLSWTRARVVRAARTALASAGERDVVLVGHGTALTMLVAGLTGELPDIAGWESMGAPDHAVLEVRLSGKVRIASPWGAWTT